MKYHRIFILNAAVFWAAVAMASVGTVDSSSEEPDEISRQEQVGHRLDEMRDLNELNVQERAFELQQLLEKSRAEQPEAVAGVVQRSPAVLGPATETPTERVELYRDVLETAPIEVLPDQR